MIRLFITLCLVPLLSAQSLLPVKHRTWSARMDSAIQWKEPVSVSSSPLGYLYVSDAATHSITRITIQTGDVILQGGEGWDNGQFELPISIDASNGLNVYVADQQNHRIQVLDKDLHFLSLLSGAEETAEDGAFQWPGDVAISPLGDLYVIDGDRPRILRFDGQYRAVGSFGDRETGDGQLLQPRRLIWLPDNRMGVCDPSLGALVVYSAFGDPLGRWGEGVLSQPVAAAVWTGKGLFVLDGEKNAIFLFSFKGRVLAVMGPDLFPEGLLRHAVDIAVHGRQLYILNRESATLTAFELHQSGAPQGS